MFLNRHGAISTATLESSSLAEFTAQAFGLLSKALL